MDTEEALLREYEKVVDLFKSELRLVWELVSIYMLVQVGLFSTIAVLLSEGKPFTPFGYPLLFPAGAISSFAWFLMLYRSKIRRDNWFLVGLRTERRLRNSGITLDIFQTEFRVKEDKLALEYFKSEDIIRFRNLRWFERIGAVRVAHYAMLFVGIVWLTVFFYFLS